MSFTKAIFNKHRGRVLRDSRPNWALDCEPPDAFNIRDFYVIVASDEALRRKQIIQQTQKQIAGNNLLPRRTWRAKEVRTKDGDVIEW